VTKDAIAYYFKGKYSIVQQLKWKEQNEEGRIDEKTRPSVDLLNLPEMTININDSVYPNLMETFYRNVYYTMQQYYSTYTPNLP